MTPQELLLELLNIAGQEGWFSDEDIRKAHLWLKENV